jgi:hypothetical protein
MHISVRARLRRYSHVFQLLLPRPERYISFGPQNEADVTLQYLSGYFAEAEQRALLGELRSTVAAAPLFTPTTLWRVTKPSA